MKTISLHGVDGALDLRIREKARQMGQSVNKTVKNLLQKALGLSRDKGNQGLFRDLCGAWTDTEHRDFQKKTEGFGRIDPEDWK